MAPSLMRPKYGDQAKAVAKDAMKLARIKFHDWQVINDGEIVLWLRSLG